MPDNGTPLILGIDPGYTTGVCLCAYTPGGGPTSELSIIKALQIPWERRLPDLWALLDQKAVERIVVESFRLRPGRAMEQVGSAFPSVQIIGLIEGFLYARAAPTPVTYQEPCVISRVQILPEHQLNLRGLPHAADAYRHVRYYVVTH